MTVIMHGFGYMTTLQETNISPKNGILKMIFLFPRWDMLISWRVFLYESTQIGRTGLNSTRFGSG